jgi:hypothetical protein
MEAKHASPVMGKAHLSASEHNASRSVAARKTLAVCEAPQAAR